ncbi:SAM dependent methyltransferase [Prescottella equi NBRC 101255 = C 7]|uniref:SAM-dependent methyltransferase n=1 Tax=Rhodococcus hoagii TaxID=43767 RepID=UPI0003B18AC0|nr:class I SAM-dependent methyltransferase [Prescottella equi]ERN47687.1 SAM dependent methyltransferase [Prescottella equi NBRC 101255 = C 7]
MPWDIGEAQPAVRALESSGQFAREVLDIGCGPGENALFLASRGYRVWGLDAAPAAIDIARERARQRGMERGVEFEVADATDLSDYADRFVSVIDSALYHCFPEDQRHRYAASLFGACRPQARLHVVCFSDRVPDGFPGPYRITEDNLRDTLTAAGWTVQRIEPTTYTTAFTQDEMTTQPGSPVAAAAADMQVDDRGRLLVPAWLATAERT